MMLLTPQVTAVLLVPITAAVKSVLLPVSTVAAAGETETCTAVGAENVAVTAWLELIVTVQLAVPEQAPDHPANAEPVLGVAVSMTTVPAAKLRQPDPHEVPGGDALTVPLPVPDVPVVKV
jgi:hypothetical protein